MRLLICGVPGTGKTTFAKWLESTHGFTRCSSDELPGRLGQCVDRIVANDADAVLDWGFPASDPGFDQVFPAIRSLVEDHGFDHWWFDGDAGAAHESFIKRNTVPVELLEPQLAGIDLHRAEIEAFFAGRILEVISAGPVHLEPAAILRLIKDGA